MYFFVLFFFYIPLIFVILRCWLCCAVYAMVHICAHRMYVKKKSEWVSGGCSVFCAAAARDAPLNKWRKNTFFSPDCFFLSFFYFVNVFILILVILARKSWIRSFHFAFGFCYLKFFLFWVLFGFSIIKKTKKIQTQVCIPDVEDVK